MKGDATVRLFNGSLRRAEIHWYEAHGVGKRSVGSLCLALESEESRTGAAEAIRALVEAIVLEPDADQLKITLKGDLTGMLSAAETARGRQKPATSWSKSWLRGRDLNPRPLGYESILGADWLRRAPNRRNSFSRSRRVALERVGAGRRQSTDKKRTLEPNVRLY